jgi:5-methylcytosine-specific restriction endonuclease McrA
MKQVCCILRKEEDNINKGVKRMTVVGNLIENTKVYFRNQTTKDHIVPKSKGGKDMLSNTQTICVICNTKKGDTLWV